MATSRHMGPILALRSSVRPQPTLLRLAIASTTTSSTSRATRRAAVHVSAAPSTSTVHPPTDLSSQTRAIPKLSGIGPFPQDVQFEALGAPYSMLSVSLPSSATLYSRRGTLVGVNGKVENATSTLTLLEPVRRAALRIPFLYQKIVSTSPLTCLISTNALHTSFAVIKLDGTVDWMILQKKALLAWCGHSISVKPTINRKLSLSHWGNSKVTGRGLVALSGKGQIFQVVLEPGEEFIVHANNLLAYSRNTPRPPQPYRLPANTISLQIPALPKIKNAFTKIKPDIEFFRVMANTDAFKALSRGLWNVRLWYRRTIWGDREFLRFQGPVTVLIQSRSNNITDVLTRAETRNVDVALTEPEALTALEGRINPISTISPSTSTTSTPILASSGSTASSVAGSSPRVANAGKPRETAPTKPSWAPAGIKVAIIKNGKAELQDADPKDFLSKK